MPDRRSLPPRSQPYDPANGLRIGAFAGGLAGAGPTVVLGPGAAWPIFVGAAVGAAAGLRGGSSAHRSLAPAALI